MADQDKSAPPKRVLVEDIMTAGVYRVTTDMKIRDVIVMLCKRHISGAPVIDRIDTVVSVITEGDALRLAASEGLDATVASCLGKMSKPDRLITLKRDASFTDAYKIFLHQRIHRIIVVDAASKLQGVVSRSNILRLLVEGHAVDHKAS